MENGHQLHSTHTGQTEQVFRVYVEKRDRYDVEAKSLLADLKDNLKINLLDSLRLLNRYDVEGITQDVFENACESVFAQPNTDDIYTETFTVSENWRMFATEFLPGQYDQREDSTAQTLQILSNSIRPIVACARIICLQGDFTEDDFDKIKNYLVNPVESRLATIDKPSSLKMSTTVPENIGSFDGFINYDENALREFWQSEGIAMNFNDLQHCQKYFRDVEKRDPFITELKVIDTYWSDHCRHTTFLTNLERVEVEKGKLSKAVEDALNAYYRAREEVYGDRLASKQISLMDMATMGMRLLKKQGKIPDLDESAEINACSIKVPIEVDGKTEQWLIQFKNETHNHPTEIEPFGGASTCLGGAIRDPLSGRAYVYQAMRITGSGNPLVPFEETLEGKLPTFQITRTAASGYSSYANQIGLASGYLREIYDDGYVAKRMELGAVVSACPAENVVREVPVAGDVILLVGGKTGRDGCGGATGSSKPHTTESSEDCSAEVQKGCPTIERNIQRLFRKPEISTLIRRCNDFGAGGVCVAIGELADGLDINLDMVKPKYDGLDGTELAISESQERMAVVIGKDDVAKFVAAADVENLETSAVAVVTDSNRLVIHWRGNTIVDLSRDFLNTSGATQVASAVITTPNEYENYREQIPPCLSVAALDECFKTNLTRLKVCSQNGLLGRFDSSVGGNTVNLPLGGKFQLTPEETMVAKIPLEKGNTDDATAMAYGFIPGISRWSPFHGAAFAVTQSLARLAAVGAPVNNARLSFQEYFESLKDEPTRWGKPAAALLGAFTAQKGFGVPSIGGKDSMSGSFNDVDVPPTLVSFAISVTKASKTGTAAFQKSASLVAFLPLPMNKETYLPDYEQASALYTKVSKLVQSGDIMSAGVVDDGGVAATVSKMSFGNKVGFSFSNGIERKSLFAPLSGSFVVELKEGDMCLSGLDYSIIGTTIDEKVITLDNAIMALDELIKCWTSTLESVFPSKADDVLPFAAAEYAERAGASPAIKISKPTVFIPIFPGTNSEYETIKAFENAGANVRSLVFRNLTKEQISQSIAAMKAEIDNAQIVALPGGMTLGDEPDGAGKFIAALLRREKLAEALTELIEKRDGLMIGFGDGFNALLRLGLVIEGKISDVNHLSPALCKNTIGRHVCAVPFTKITSTKSPWHNYVEAGDIFRVPVSSGEGRFVATDEIITKLANAGQIASQFTSPNGEIAFDSEGNPFGSTSAIESLASPCGRILGKLGLVERNGENILRNINFDKDGADMQLFKSGVDFFK